MPDQYGRVTGRDWMGLAGTISSIDSMRRGQEYLEMRQAGEKREATKFEQSQEDRVKKKGGENVYNNVFAGTIRDYVDRGLADPAGKTFTQEGLETLVDTPGDRNQAMKGLEQYGEYAAEAARAVAAANQLLLSNEETRSGLNKILLDRSDKNFKVVSDLIDGGEASLMKGDEAGSATDLAEAMERSGYRTHAKTTKDNKIEVWQVVMGKRQPSQIYTPQEALIEARKLRREEFVTQTAAEKGAGIESNLNPKTTAIVDPQGKTHYYRQNFKLDGSVEYLTFGPDHKPSPNDPPTLEQAYDKGWMNEEDFLKREKATADLAYTEAGTKKLKAGTKKIQAETKEVGKPKPSKTEKADKPEKELVALEKSGKRWSEITKPDAMTGVDFDTGKGRVKPHNLSNFNALQKTRKLPIMVEQKDEEGNYDYIPDVSIYVDKGDKLEEATEGKGIEYIRSLPAQTQDLVVEVLRKRQAKKDEAVKEKRKGKQKKANVKQKAREAREKAAEAAKGRNILYRQVDEAIRQ